MSLPAPAAIRRDPFALAAGVVLLGSLAFVAAHDDLRLSSTAVILGLLVAGIGYGALILRGRSARAFADPESRLGTVAILALGVVARLVMLTPESGLSDDYFRYVWEGRVVLAGENPYLLAPDAEELAPLRDDVIWPRVTHRDIPAAYPPLAQAWFALAAATPWPILFLRISFLACELLAIAVIVWLLRERGASRALVAALVLAPLSIVEYAGSLHFDSAALALLALAWWASRRTRPVTSALLLALACLAKPFPAILLPLLLERRAWRSQLIAFVAVLVGGYLPFARSGVPFEGLFRYAEEWSFNAPLFPAVVRSLGALRDALFDHGGSWLPFGHSLAQWIVETPPERIARGVFGVTFLVLAMRAYWPWRADGLTREQRALRVMLALLLCSPVVHPWYVTWLLPLAALAAASAGGSDRMANVTWLWAALAPLGYHVLPDFVEFGIWREDRVWRAAQYAPVLLSIAWVSVFSAKSDTGTIGADEARTGNSDARPAQ